LKERKVCKDEEEEDISNYWTTNGKWKELEFERRSTITHPLEKIALATGYGSVARQTKQRLRMCTVA
jgi:hypothetical protein